MLKRTDIVDCEMLHDLRIIAGFNCHNWECENCPLFTSDGGCISLDIQRMLDKYDRGEEVIF